MYFYSLTAEESQKEDFMRNLHVLFNTVWEIGHDDGWSREFDQKLINEVFDRCKSAIDNLSRKGLSILKKEEIRTIVDVAIKASESVNWECLARELKSNALKVSNLLEKLDG